MTAFSQKDTDSIPNQKCFTIPVVKLIVKDLLSGDSAKAELNITQTILDSTEKKVILKDSIIDSLETKVDNCENIVNMERKKYEVLENHTKKVEFQLKKEKVKNKFKSIVSSGLLVSLGILYIVK